MTEAKAKKILDYLIRRFQRHPQTTRLKSMCIVKRGFYQNLVISYVAESTNSSNCLCLWAVEASCYISSCAACDNDRLMLKEKGNTAKNIVECLFKTAKNKNIVNGLNIYVPFIFKGETPEEILVKADLEEIA